MLTASHPDAGAFAPLSTSAQGSAAPALPHVAIAIAGDYAEEGWVSMDLVADMLASHVPGHAPLWHSELLRPPMVRPLSQLSFGRRGQAIAWNADRLLNRFLAYPRYLRRRQRDFSLFHITDHSYAHLVHAVQPARTVVTCHDLDAFRCLLDPSRNPRPRWFRALAARTWSGLLAADRILCVSETVREELLSAGGVDAHKVSVVYNGAHPTCRPEPDGDLDATVAARADLSSFGPVLLHVGSTVPRKRLDTLLGVFAGVRRHHPAATLVRVGGPLTSEQRALAARLDVLHAIREMPFLDRRELAALYRRADLLLLTSEAEGFGLPLVEAMACGCPVVASDLAVAREVCGAAAIYCPVGDVSAWTESVRDLLAERSSSPDLSASRRRQSLSAASRFSWQENARQVVRIYQQLL